MGLGLERIVRDQLAPARAILVDGQTPPDKAVQETRKALKRVRSVLRLVRDPLGPWFSEQNARWRDLGRLLASRRHSDAALATIDRLEREADEDIASHLAAARGRIRALGRQAVDARLEVARALESPVELAEQLPDGDWDLIAVGLRRSYSRGRKAMKRVAKDPTAEDCHEWRKRAKDLWHHTLIIMPACRDLLKPTASYLRDLSRHLGDLHDLDELERMLVPRGQGRAVGRAPAPLHRLIEKLREKDLKKALRLGAQIYAERPKPFVRRLEGYWLTWRSESEVEDVPESAPVSSNRVAGVAR
jgi:CHAD domain-containing protein